MAGLRWSHPRRRGGPTPEVALSESREILLTPAGEARVEDLARRQHEAGRDVSELQFRVLVDQLVDEGQCFALGPGTTRIRSLLRAGGIDAAPGDPAAGLSSSGIRRIPPDHIARTVAAAEGTRGLVVGALARAVGAGGQWDDLLHFLRGPAAERGVLAVPWPRGGLPVRGARP